MEMKHNRLVQVVTLAFALTMLVSYLAYSQRQRARVVSAASAPVTPNRVHGLAASGHAATTNRLPESSRSMVAPGSKVMAPIVSIEPSRTNPAPAISESSARAFMLAAGSKSAPVFDLRPPPQSQTAKTSPSAAKAATNKPAAIVHKH